MLLELNNATVVVWITVAMSSIILYFAKPKRYVQRQLTTVIISWEEREWEYLCAEDHYHSNTLPFFIALNSVLLLLIDSTISNALAFILFLIMAYKMSCATEHINVFERIEISRKKDFEHFYDTADTEDDFAYLKWVIDLFGEIRITYENVKRLNTWLEPLDSDGGLKFTNVKSRYMTIAASKCPIKIEEIDYEKAETLIKKIERNCERKQAKKEKEHSEYMLEHFGMQ